MSLSYGSATPFVSRISVSRNRYAFFRLLNVLHGNLMKRTDQRPLKQTECAFDGVCVNVAAHVFVSAVVDRFMVRRFAAAPANG